MGQDTPKPGLVQLYSSSALLSCHPGQSHLRSEDRFRHITNERTRVRSVYPIKRKRSHDRGLTPEERLVPSTFKCLLIRSMRIFRSWPPPCWNVVGGSVRWAGAVYKRRQRPRSTRRRALRPPGIQQSAPSAPHQHMRTILQSWTNQLRWSRNPEKRQTVWRRRQKALLVHKYR